MPIVLIPAETIAYSLLLKEVMLYLPMALEFDVEYRLKQAARDFCRRSLVWRQPNTELLTTVADQSSYDAELPDGTELAAVLSAWNGSTEIDVELPGEVDDYEPGSSASTWKVGVELTMDALRLTPAPSTAGIVLTGTIALAPNEDAVDLPAFVWKRWRTPVASGCIALVKAQTGKPWSDPGAVAYHRELFEAGILDASNKAGPVRRRPLRVRTY
jgi:hypothetical protein